MWTRLTLLVLLTGVSATVIDSRQKPSKPLSAASFYVPNIPNLSRDPNSSLHVWAGNLNSDPNAKPEPTNEVSAHIFFVLTKARRIADRERLIIWFNGGPGCSSFDGLMMEIGPWRMNKKDSLRQKEGGWEEYANVLYLDQPPGTGFSYASTNKYVHELDEAANHVVEFLKNWYEVFPEYKDMDTYLAGESFAGQYIPYIADAILKTARLPTRLRGAAIGNGWIDPFSQYPAYVDFAIKEKLLKTGTKEYERALQALDQCKKRMNGTEQATPNYGECELVMGATVRHLDQTVNGVTTCLNIYDIRLSDTYPACGMNWPPDLTFIKPYLHRDDVKTAFHASGSSEGWTECRGTVSSNLYMKKSPPSIRLMPGILERIPVLLFHGDQDLICNYLGAERLIEALTWNGARGFSNTTKPQSWKFNGTEVGEWTSDRNLTYVKVYGASHMVGFDLPHVAHDMILRFMGVDFTSLLKGSATIPSEVGGTVKPIIQPSLDKGDGDEHVKLPSQDDPALWQAYYNAGSAALVLVLIALALGLFFYFRMKRRNGSKTGVALARDEEESIPLSRNIGGEIDDYIPVSTQEVNGQGVPLNKGKAKVVHDDNVTPREAIFDVGDDDDEMDMELKI
ncbi:alpha/beta-hydrolase [Cantharellus anzutake]|uniref:alpha/beta-hydrolase n=1 Tax=Cantharellus anzutake TaxID=1750568 RepID=UPI001904C0BF|nr:alpha/beta-hydrolase [Cantharellus anzutake]KAF8316977.1 alpha/beta-hydrolase [Cantharellus anzutake]